MMHADIKIKGVMLSYGIEVGVGFSIWKEKIGDACTRDYFDVLSRDWLSRKGHILFTRRIACIVFCSDFGFVAERGLEKYVCTA